MSATVPNEMVLAALGALFDAGAAKHTALDCHWICGRGEDSVDYCRDCALKRIEEMKAEDPSDEPMLDGGWRTEHDSTPYCDTCGALLDGSLTDYGAEQEVDHFLEHGFDPNSDEDCRAMADVIGALGWAEHGSPDAIAKLAELLTRIATQLRPSTGAATGTAIEGPSHR